MSTASLTRKRSPRSPAPPPSPNISALAEQLDGCLGQLHELLGALGDNAAAKFAALRRADIAELQRIAAAEEAALRTTAAVEQKRAALLAGLAQALQWPGVRAARLEDVAERLPEPAASRIRARSTGLREKAAHLKKNTRLVADVARGLQSHIRAVLAELAGAHLETVGYGALGRHQKATARTRVDAMG